APGQVGDHLREAHFAEQIPRRRIDPDAAGRGHPDIAALVAFHAVGQSWLQLGADAAGEHTRIGKQPVGLDVEGTDQRLHGIVDIEHALVWREAQPVRLLEQMAVDQQFRRATAWRYAVDALETELPRPLNAIDRHAAIPGIAEVDRAAGMDADVVRAV